MAIARYNASTSSDRDMFLRSEKNSFTNGRLSATIDSVITGKRGNEVWQIQL